MKRIPKVEQQHESRIKKEEPIKTKILFSFEKLDKNDYFNLDKTCQNWASELFDTMQKASDIDINDVNTGKYSNKNNPFRIHSHDVKPPCSLPTDISEEQMWQIRISVNKGGIHGYFIGNVFYAVWFDPHHNWYPDKDKGGLTRIRHLATTCCKERDEILKQQKIELDEKDAEIIKLNEDINALLEK